MLIPICLFPSFLPEFDTFSNGQLNIPPVPTGWPTSETLWGTYLLSSPEVLQSHTFTAVVLQVVTSSDLAREKGQSNSETCAPVPLIMKFLFSKERIKGLQRHLKCASEGLRI